MATNILSYLENSVQKYPDKIAFADIDSALTFSELESRSKAIGTSLACKLPPRSPAVFLMEKSTALMAGFLGAVSAGCFYVLLDTKHPAARLKSVLCVLEAQILITDNAHLNIAQSLDFAGQIVLLEDLASAAIDDAALAAIRAQMLDIDPLYAIFTSGSTGVPKGVVVSHRSTLDFIDTFTQTFGITHHDVIGNQAPFDFDVSVKDIYSGLCSGATVQIIPRAFFSFPTKLMDFLCERKITVLIWAVSALCFVTTMKGLDYKVPHTLQKIMFSGEVMPIKHLNIWRHFLPQVQYVNLYGPTEITCNCTYYILDRDYAESEVLPIGKAFFNEKVFLLDENDREILSADILGEICVSGTALSLGYYNDPNRTAQVFTQNPLNKYFTEPIYRTGDLAKYDSDGNLIYVTRKDFQIKHMGHRIEMGEIEAAFGAIDGVTRACCLYDAEKQRIIGCYEGSADKKFILRALKQTLPFFMIPNSFVCLQTLPLTKNGKIDRTLLKEMTITKKKETP